MTPGKSYNRRNTSAYIKIQTPQADGPPHSEAKAGNGIQLYILSSFIYIYCHFMYCLIWSGASGQVSHAFLSMANFCQFLYDFIMLLLLLCVTQQHIYVVVVDVVVVYYTSGTITTTRFIEIDYEVFVK